MGVGRRKSPVGERCPGSDHRQGRAARNGCETALAAKTTAENNPFPPGAEKRDGESSPHRRERRTGSVTKGERLYLAVSDTAKSRKENPSRPDALQTGTDFQPAPPPLRTSLEGEGRGLGRGKLFFRKVFPPFPNISMPFQAIRPIFHPQRACPRARKLRRCSR